MASGNSPQSTLGRQATSNAFQDLQVEWPVLWPVYLRLCISLHVQMCQVRISDGHFHLWPRVSRVRRSQTTCRPYTFADACLCVFMTLVEAYCWLLIGFQKACGPKSLRLASAVVPSHGEFARSRGVLVVIWILPK